MVEIILFSILLALIVILSYFLGGRYAEKYTLETVLDYLIDEGYLAQKKDSHGNVEIKKIEDVLMEYTMTALRELKMYEDSDG